MCLAPFPSYYLANMSPVCRFSKPSACVLCFPFPSVRICSRSAAAESLSTPSSFAIPCLDMTLAQFVRSLFPFSPLLCLHICLLFPLGWQLTSIALQLHQVYSRHTDQSMLSAATTPAYRCSPTTRRLTYTLVAQERPRVTVSITPVTASSAFFFFPMSKSR